MIQTDASDSGLGAVLLQIINDEERVLEFASRTMNAAERNYSVTERECLAVIWAVKKFRCYIEGHDFKIITDHSSLRWLCNLHNPTGRLARWALELQGYTYTVVHRKGTLNHVPDALSRMHEDVVLSATNVSALSWVSQTTDKWYNDQRTKVLNNPNDHPRLKVIGGQLYRYVPDQATEETLGNDENAWKLVVPKEHRSDVLIECHDVPTAGHLGRDKTLARVKQYYYWPHMDKFVAQYVKSCEVCQQCKLEQ